MAYQGDNSEESKATIQKLKVQLKENEEALESDQYDRYVSDQKALLDDFKEEYSTIINERLDNIDQLMTDMIDDINKNSKTVADTLKEQSDKVGYTLTQSLQDIWSNEGGANTIITKYGDNFTNQLTSVNTVLNSIAAKVGAQAVQSDKIATSVTSTEKEQTSVVKPVAATSNSSNNNTASTTANTTNKKSSTTKVTDKIKKGVAGAIYLDGSSKSGWGSNSTRKKRLKEKFGSSGQSSIQSYINKHGRNGDLYKYWKKEGRSKLKNYYYKKFKTGGLVDYTGQAWLDGTPSKPELVLNQADTANFIALKEAMQSIANGNTPLSSMFTRTNTSTANPLKNIQSNGIGTTIENVNYQINIPIDHVQDYADFMNKMRSDGQFEKMIQSMTVDRLVGGNKMAKNKYNW